MPEIEGQAPDDMTLEVTPAEEPSSEATPAAPEDDRVKRANSEAAKYRKALRDAEAKVAAFETEKLTEAEKVAKRAQEAESKLSQMQDRVLRSELKAAARNAGLVDADVALLLVDRGRIEYDEDGEPTNLDVLMGELVKSKPYLKGSSAPAAPQITTTNPGGSRTQAAGVFTRAQLRDQRFYEQNEPAIRQALREGRILD